MMEILSQQGFILAIISFGIGALGSLIFGKSEYIAHRLGSFFAVVGSLLGFASGLAVILSGNHPLINIPSLLPLISINISIDALSAFFVAVISAVAFLATVYGIGYMNHFRKLRSFYFFYNIFIASMLLVVTAQNAFYFLMVWELMSLSSYFLVIFKNEEEDNVRAGLVYLIMTHIGTAFISLAFLIIYRFAGSFDFEMIKNNFGALPAAAQFWSLLFALIGFGIKAGIIPLHSWLPKAHPAAPSHVSALMSGVMIKIGIFMLIKFFLDFAPAVSVWWGLAILLLGAVSSLLGVLYALTEHDIKRLLAYHSVENIGIILMGLGSAVTFSALGFKSLALVGITASLFHIMNHAVFKALLFLGAGAVVMQTHSKNMEEYGGLIKRMPQTTFFFLIGSVAISALPPFNGFASEWLTFQALFSGISSSGFFVKSVFFAAAASLAFTGGLAAACFVKAFGITFLARPRSKESRQAEEVKFPLRFSMAALSLLALALGIFSGAAVSWLAKISTTLRSFQGIDIASLGENQLNVANINLSAQLSMPFVAAAVIFALAITVLGVYIVSRKQKVKICGTWDCGTELTPRMEITGTGFSRSLISIFKGVLKPTKQTDSEYHDADMRYFAKSSKVELGIRDIYESYLNEPLHKIMLLLAEQAKKIQSGNINLYVLYIFIALIATFIFAL